MKYAVLAACLLLAACNDPAQPEPFWGCMKQGQPYACGKGGTCWPCNEYGITCPKPTVIAQGDGKLICKLGDPS